MKTILAVLVLFSVLPRASAQILLDGFLDNTFLVSTTQPPSSVITNNIDGTQIDRQISVSATGPYSIVSQVLDGVFVADAGGTPPGTADVEIEYLGFLLDLGANTFFEFSTDRIAGTPLLGLILNDANLGQISGGLQLGPVTSTTVFSIDLTQFVGYTAGFGSALNSVRVFLGTSNEAMFVEANSFSFSPVPEPSAFLLVGLGLLPGLLARRRSQPAH